MTPSSDGPLALVLAGGGARGAYEVGVAQYLIDVVGPETGIPLPFDILTGTSAGAVNACVLAAAADEPGAGIHWLADAWRSLEIAQVFRLACPTRGAILRASWLEGLIAPIPFGRIGDHLRDRRLAAVALAATHVGSGRTVVFAQRGRPIPADGRRCDVREVDLSARHAMASAAIPFLLPAVNIDGELYCDGGIHQLVPLGPALRLGASRLLVVSLRYAGPESPAVELARERAVASPAYLVGKTLDALLVDRIDEDMRELETINGILRAGARRFGATFAQELNEELAVDGRHPLYPRASVVVQPGRDLGQLAGDYVRSHDFARRAGGAAGRLLRRLADTEGSRETDLISYLLFDGHFADLLIAQGRADARLRHDELCALVTGHPSTDTPALPASSASA